MTDKCAGENCTSIDGFNHSVECLFEHFTAYTGAHREPIDVLRKIKKAYFDGYEAAATAQPQSDAVIVPRAIAELKAEMSGVDERVAFEAAYLKANYPRVAAGELSAPPIFGRVGSMKFHGQAEGDYECSDVQTCWVIWQARAQLPSQEAKASPAEVPYALRQWAMDDEPESTLFDEGYNAARRWVKMQLEKPAEPTERILWYTGNTADPTEPVEVVGYLYAVCDDLLLDHQKPNLPNEPLMTVAQHKRILADMTANRNALLLANAELAAPKAEQPPVQEPARNPDVLALNAAREIMALVYGPTPLGGSPQLLAQIQCVVSEAIAYAAPQPVSDDARG